ncbi:MAG: hypothetical protein HYX67_02865 [Candidatus Melainabacteria bacterium]|nr:hypothetical protein [Candidatus Melainabacteria bacterium]
MYDVNQLIILRRLMLTTIDEMKEMPGGNTSTELKTIKSGLKCIEDLIAQRSKVEIQASTDDNG